MKSNIEVLSLYKTNSPLIKKALCKYKHSLFFKVNFGNYLEVKILLSKNQAFKYTKYNKLPSILPLDIRNLSNFSFKAFNTNDYKNKGFSKIKIGDLTYIHKVGFDVEHSNTLNKLIKSFILNN